MRDTGAQLLEFLLEEPEGLMANFPDIVMITEVAELVLINNNLITCENAGLY